MKQYDPVVTLRIPQKTLDQIEDAMKSRRTWQLRKRWGFRWGTTHDDGRTAWILRAIREKLAKLLRGRKPRRRRGTSPLPLADKDANS